MKKLFIVLSFVLVLTSLFCACGKDSGTSGGGKEDNGKISVEEITELASYTIVRSEQANEIEKKAMTDLRDTIKEKLGVELNVSTDWGSSSGKEIIIGDTKRSASKTAMESIGGDYDYLIKMDGKNIVIVGGSSEAIAEAVGVFTSNFITGGKLYAPTGAGHCHLIDYPTKKLTIDGNDISEYKLYYIEDMGSEYAKKNSEFVTVVRDLIGEKTGVRLEMRSTVSQAQKTITVDTTELSYTKGAIKVEDGNLILYGSYHSIDYVIDYFINTLLGDNEEVAINENIELDSGDTPTVYSKDDLMAVLRYAYDNDDVLIVGDEIGGSRDVPSHYLEKYKNGNLDEEGGYYTGTGTYPSIMGVDLGRCGMLLGFIEDHEWAVVSQMICESIDYAAQGGIVTLASHWRNPTFPEDLSEWQSERGSIGHEKAWTELITPGTELNTNFHIELDRVAEILKVFDDAGVPIIWRPMHEMNGGWFWWTPKDENGTVLDAKYYVDLWRYIYDYYTDEWELDNLIWHYSPSTATNPVNSMYFYPGDEYCDILGVDWYTDGSGPSEAFIETSYGGLMETGKIVNLAEIGISESLMAEDIRDQDNLYNAHDFFRTTIEAMLGEDLKAAFFATYTHKHSLAYLPGGDEIMQSEMVIDLSEMPALFEQVTGFKVGK